MIRKILTAIFLALALALAPATAFAQSNPNLTYGQVPTAAQWNSYFSAKEDVLAYTPVNKAGDIMTGELITAPSTASVSGINVAPGTPPSSPSDGDLWITSSSIFARINGSTVDLVGGACLNCALTNFANIFTAQQTAQGLTTTQPGWFVQVTGDTVPRIHLGLTTGDVPTISFGSGSGTRDAFIQRAAVANLRHGGPDAAVPVTQTISVQNVLAGTSNIAGATLTIMGSRGTGTGVGGSIVFQTAPAGGSGSTQNALSAALTIFGTGGIASGAATDPGAGNLNLAGGSLLNNGTAPTGTGAYVRATSPSLVTPNLGVAAATSVAIGGAAIGGNALAVTGSSVLGAVSASTSSVTSTSASSFAVGANGATNPVLLINSSVVSQADGLSITGTPSGSGVAVATNSPATNSLLTINSKGTGGLFLQNAATGPITLVTATTASAGLTVATSFTATGLVTFADMATAAVATSSQYFSGSSSVLVPASIIYSAETTTTFGATTSFDFNTFINTVVTLTGNITTQTLTNVTAGKAGSITLIQDGTGSRTTVWNAIFKFASGITPTLSVTPNAVDVLFYSCRSATNCPASLVKDVR